MTTIPFGCIQMMFLICNTNILIANSILTGIAVWSFIDAVKVLGLQYHTERELKIKK